MQGKIIKGIAGFYYIYAEDGNIYECKAKGIFRKDNFKPLVGDNVEITVLNEEEKEGSVTSILPRRNSLIRPAVANVDQAFLIFAMENPKPNFLLLDRFLIMMKQQEIPAVICFNKKDVGEKEEMEKLYEIYTGCGYRVVLSSTYEGEGMDEIHEILKGKTTVVAGPSGVGKSSITNCMQGEVQMETGEISKKLKRGKHTTRHSQVIPVEKNTFLVDTPGFSSLYLTDMKEEELRDYFPEFAMYEPQCRFQGCMHIHEPGCAVKEALSEGKISQQRYDNYLALYEELKEKRRY
ncbi:ribosome small subunit-dependent GTPase A [Ruminococcus sp. 1001136sp1]|uniref:ribosome small subunit-dependent GTPase A n=1 Tax=unclassified Ruminococcus TaxID=2608920 RepID=UPI00189FB347|nr:MULTISPECIES: ribosome small subunit-dependent GTPase A [unclassified Ruminococcus]MDB8773494.1 ribosome small subunit-dependent GTPase A [Ruminococcus sp. 1001136sp1]MDB8784516.1 ribosome small subunit-dependent GTPase A [Ruminococcus sp. 1001136sp1]